MIQTKKFWANEFEDRVEINPINACKIQVNIGVPGDCVVIDKMYGPMVGEEVRIYINKDYEYVVERRNIGTDKWEIKAQWDIQESYDTANDPNSEKD